MGLETVVGQLKKISKRTPARIKVVTADGHHRKFDAPISVKDVLAEYPGHSIFVSDNRYSRPLNNSVLLQPGKLYSLTQAPQQRQSPRKRSISNRGPARSDSTIGLMAFEKGAQKEGSRHVSFASTPSYIEPVEDPAEAGEVANGSSSSTLPMEV